jgi:hypothetical protein
MTMNFEKSQDESLLHFYECVRRQADADRNSGERYRLAGEGVKQYADRLREEMDRRRCNLRRLIGLRRKTEF